MLGIQAFGWGAGAPVGSGFPLVAASVSDYESAGLTSHTLDLPSGIASGQLLLLIIANAGTATATVADWTQLVTWNSNSVVQLTVYARVATGGEGGTVGLTLSAGARVAYVAHRITSWGGTLSDVAVTTGQFDNFNSDLNLPSFNPAGWDVEKTLWVAAYAWANGSDTVSAYPANCPLYQVSQGGVNIGVAAAAAESEVAAFDVDTFSRTGTGWVLGATIAVRP
jgi:hypothetical protein